MNDVRGPGSRHHFRRGAFVFILGLRAFFAGNVATIRVLNSLLTPMNDPEILRQLVQQTPKGTIEFDMQQGRVLNRTLQIDEKVVGAFGAQTLLQANGECVEKLIPPDSLKRVSSNPPNALPK